MVRRGQSVVPKRCAVRAVWPELGHNRERDQQYGAVRTLLLAAGRRQVASERPLKLGAASASRRAGTGAIARSRSRVGENRTETTPSGRLEERHRMLGHLIPPRASP